MPKLMSLEAVVEHLQRILPNNPAKTKVIEFATWIRDWSPTQTATNQVFSYLRESINVGYVLDRDDNRTKRAKPNCLVIKCPRTDREFKGLHLDFYLDGGYSPLATYLNQRPSNLVRWVVVESDLLSISLEELKTIFLTACSRRGGLLKI